MSPASPSPIRPTIGEREFVALVALLQALHAFAIDAMLPGLGVLATELGETVINRRQLVVGAFLIGMGVGSLVPGSLADRFGRKPVLLGCIGAYIVLSLVSALVTSLETLIAIRFVQGLASAGLSVLPGAIIRDRFEGDRMARLQSLVSVVFMVVPMIAPSLGQAILLFAGWRWIFGLMALLGLAMFGWVAIRMPETLHPEFRQSLGPRAIARNMKTTLLDRSSIGYVLSSALILGVGWGFIQSCQQLVAEHFGAGEMFPLVFGGMALAMAASNFTNSRIVERFGARRVSHAALLSFIAVTLVHLVVARSGSEVLWQFALAQTLCMMLMGFTGANFGSIALQPFARIAGAASSVQAFVRLVLASLIGWVVGQAYDQTAIPFVSSQVAAGLAALALVLFSERGQLFRRLLPPGVPRPEF
jgi:DHA1 family bicyclomycin/chloramphenicol resistance-like MFS transporter